MSSEATPAVGVYDVLAWLEANKKQLAVGFVVAVVLGFGIAIYKYNVDQKELQASDALLQLKTTLSGSDTNPQPATAYIDVAKRYPGTDAAQRAVFLAGMTLFSEGKYADARAEFAKFIHDNQESPFAAGAAYGAAACLDAEGKTDEALAGYQNLSVRYPNSSVLEDAKMSVARLYEAKNQPDQALRIYDEISKLGPVGTAGSEAMTRREALLTKHPELAKTNAPVVSLGTTVIPARTNAAVVATTNLGAAKP